MLRMDDIDDDGWMMLKLTMLTMDIDSCLQTFRLEITEWDPVNQFTTVHYPDGEIRFVVRMGDHLDPNSTYQLKACGMQDS